jgi:hypothetical protein
LIPGGGAGVLSQQQHQFSFFITPTTPDEVISTVLGMKNSSSRGFDEVPSTVLKQVIHTIAEPLSQLINHSFTSGVFPDDLKTTKVVPLFKSGDKTLVSSYRPISLVSVFSKTIENIMFTRLSSIVVGQTQHLVSVSVWVQEELINKYGLFQSSPQYTTSHRQQTTSVSVVS